MKKAIVATTFSLALGLCALAQMPSGSTQQPSGTNPSTQTQSPSMGDPGMSNGTQNTANDMKSQKKLKGCIKSESGKYMLEEKGGKEVALGGSQDFSSHVGHTVTVHGTWGSGSDASNASSGSAMSAGSGQFMVSKLDMVSESCKMEKGSNSQDSTNSKPSPNHM